MNLHAKPIDWKHESPAVALLIHKMRGSADPFDVLSIDMETLPPEIQQFGLVETLERATRLGLIVPEETSSAFILTELGERVDLPLAFYGELIFQELPASGEFLYANVEELKIGIAASGPQIDRDPTQLCTFLALALKQKYPSACIRIIQTASSQGTQTIYLFDEPVHIGSAVLIALAKLGTRLEANGSPGKATSFRHNGPLTRELLARLIENLEHLQDFNCGKSQPCQWYFPNRTSGQNN